MQDTIWFEPLVWMDYWLTVLFTAVIPLILLVWAFVQRSEAMQRLLIIYWRVASLLLVAVYLMIPGWSIAFIASFLARIIIPISLWFWVDLNEEIDDQPQRPLKLFMTAWRWAVSVYCALGALAAIPFLRCAFISIPSEDAACKVLLRPSWLYYKYFHPNSNPEFLGFWGMVGLLIYVVYLSYFLLIRLGKQGRSAMEH